MGVCWVPLCFYTRLHRVSVSSTLSMPPTYLLHTYNPAHVLFGAKLLEITNRVYDNYCRNERLTRQVPRMCTLPLFFVFSNGVHFPPPNSLRHTHTCNRSGRFLFFPRCRVVVFPFPLPSCRPYRKLPWRLGGKAGGAPGTVASPASRGRSAGGRGNRWSPCRA